MRKLLSPLFHVLPLWSRDLVISTINAVTSVFYIGKGRWCPICGKSSRKFGPAGIMRRKDAKCMHCGGVERDRLAWIFLQKRTNLFNGIHKRMLHVAPERYFESRLRKWLGKDYITADLHNPHVMVKMDITNIQYPDEYFDVIYFSHVLEHVPDDKKALKELYRVLRNEGWAILLVPVVKGKTQEDLTINEPSERLRIYGDADHVRQYGIDLVDRVKEVGFNVQIIHASDLVDESQRTLMGLNRTGAIYYCTKEKSSKIKTC